MQDLNVTLVQTALHWQDPAGNRAHFTDLIDGMAEDTDLIILPEMFTTGFTMEPKRHAETMDGPTVAWLKQHAARKKCTICGSIVVREQGQFFNRLIWMPPDGNPGVYDKRHLFRMADEQNHYAAGTARRVFSVGDWRVCPLVCYDLRFPVWSRGIDEFELLLYVANWPAARRSAWQTLLPARAVENLCYVIGVNRIGTDGNDKKYAGDSVIVDHLGHALLDCGAEEGVRTATLSGQTLLRYRKKFPAHLDADSFDIHKD